MTLCTTKNIITPDKHCSPAIHNLVQTEKNEIQILKHSLLVHSSAQHKNSMEERVAL